MTEHDDIFDELIGADIDDPEELDEMDEPEEDDAETLSARTALLTKNDMLALLGLRVTTRGSLIIRVDPRQSLPSAQTYEDAAKATHWFKRSLATSQRNGWLIIYDGPPLVG